MALSREARTAAKWWAEAVCNPSFDNGDKSDLGGMTMAMALMAAKPAGSDQAENFSQHLAQEIDRRLAQHPSLTLDVDYGPDPILSAAAQAAGVSSTAFPWKTMMWIDQGSVRVSAGYRAPSVDLDLLPDEVSA